MVDSNHRNDDADDVSKNDQDPLPFQIELTLIELSEVVRDDPSGKEIPNQVDQILQTLSCNDALSYLATLIPPPTMSPKKDSNGTKKKKRWFGRRQQAEQQDDPLEKKTQEIKDRIQKQVVRFLKVPDKYVSWGSILLKSQAFHQVHDYHAPTIPRPLMELPRTQYKKPYIPSTEKYDSFPEVNLYPISVSHQFPFVGLARLVVTEISKQPQHRPLVGLDIVTYDDYNPRLYDSAQAFVKVFKTSFTDWEWDCIHNRTSTNLHMLREFYLRWAIKEAYTKALGVGMGLSFDSFETHLSGITEEGSIYAWILEECSRADGGSSSNDYQKPLLARGFVVINPGTDTCKSEGCTFFFLPLWDVNKPAHTTAMGCACICLSQPQSTNQTEAAMFELVTKWQSLEDVVAWHENNSSVVMM